MRVIGFVGQRGLAGSVLLERMREEKDFSFFTPVFFSTTQKGEPGPQEGGGAPLQDAYALEELKKMDVVVTLQGSDYTNRVHGPLRSLGWKGYWVDAASALRTQRESTLILDPLNRTQLESALSQGAKDFVGANCTVALLLMAIGGLFLKKEVEWVSSMTYQAASGAGSRQVRELLAQMGVLGQVSLAQQMLEIDREVAKTFASEAYPQEHSKVPLGGSLIPWIGEKLPTGQTCEEGKASFEANKILGSSFTIPLDGTCVRVGSLRGHAQGLTVKLKRSLPLDEIESLLSFHPWLSLVSNSKEATFESLTPAAISGSLKVSVGRLRKLSLGESYLNVFTVGDQLLWGVAEPLRRFLALLQGRLEK